MKGRIDKVLVIMGREVFRGRGSLKDRLVVNPRQWNSLPFTSAATLLRNGHRLISGSLDSGFDRS